MASKGRYWIESERGQYELRCVFPICSPENEKLAVLKHIKPDSWSYTITIPGSVRTEILYNLSLAKAKYEVERAVGNCMGLSAEVEKARYEAFNVENTDAVSAASIRDCMNADRSKSELRSLIGKLYETYGKDRVRAMILDKNGNGGDAEPKV